MSKTICLAFFSLVVLLSLSQAANGQGRYTVQLEATPELNIAQEKVRQYKGQGLDAYIVRTEVSGKGTFYRIRAGVFSSQAEAKSYIAGLLKLGFGSDFFVALYERPTSGLNQSTEKIASVSESPASSTLPLTRAVAKDQPAANAQPVSKSLTGSTVASLVPNGSAPPSAAPTSLASINFVKFQEPTIGFSFERPQYWEGGALDPKMAQDQKATAAAQFKSYVDSAFITAIWNNLDKANSPENDNDLIVELILRSMGTSDGMQQLTETSRKVVSENGVIKTYLDLKAAFNTQDGPLDFLSKAIIVRASKGILVVATFYLKNSPQHVPALAERIVASVRPPD